MQLKSKTAIVTGAGSGLGKAIASALVHEGTQVYGLGRHQDKLDAVRNDLGSYFVPVQLDVTNHNDIKEWITQTFSAKHSLDILINNAGIGGFGKIDTMDPYQWTDIIDINLKGMYYVTESIVPLMKANPDSAHIINIGSIMGTTTKGEATAYSASKYAVNGFSEALFKELRGDNIKVTCVNPGSIETDFFVKSGIEPSSRMLHPQEVADTIIFILKTPDNVLIDEIKMRPLRP
jgi:NADP-dependent 3-hydroxy acid dehydrogenase YdfG